MSKLGLLAGAAAGAVVIVAAVDGVRNRGSDDPPAATTELQEQDVLAGRLAGLGARGELVLRGSDCRVERLMLPSLARTPGENRCAPSGAESPDGTLVARCLGDKSELYRTSDGIVQSGVPGCAPAWRPDGVLTVADGHAIVRFGPCPGPVDCPVTLISAAQLERAARRHPTSPARAPLRVLVDGIAWLSRTRAAVLISIRLVGRLAGMGPLSGIAFFENGHVLETQSFFRVTAGRLAASPRGTYVTQTPDVILRGDGSQVSLPPHLRDAHAFAWSPDERFLAIATRFAVTILDVAGLERYDTIGSGLRSVTLPLSVTELDWR